MTHFVLTRRQLLGAGAMLAAAPAVAQPATDPDDATTLAQKIRRGDASARETLVAALDRAEAAQAKLNHAIRE